MPLNPPHSSKDVSFNAIAIGKFCILWAVAGASCCQLMASEPESIANGSAWMVFRSSVITSGKGVFIGLELGSENEVRLRITNQKQLQLVLSWLADHVSSRLRRHPLNPSERLQNVAIVYTHERMDDRTDRLVQIPLNEAVLGKGSAELKRELRSRPQIT